MQQPVKPLEFYQSYDVVLRFDKRTLSREELSKVMEVDFDELKVNGGSGEDYYDDISTRFLKFKMVPTPNFKNLIVLKTNLTYW